MTAEMLDKSFTVVVWETFDYQVLIPMDFKLLSLTHKIFSPANASILSPTITKIAFFLLKEFHMVVNKTSVNKSY